MSALSAQKILRNRAAKVRFMLAVMVSRSYSDRAALVLGKDRQSDGKRIQGIPLNRLLRILMVGVRRGLESLLGGALRRGSKGKFVNSFACKTQTDRLNHALG